MPPVKLIFQSENSKQNCKYFLQGKSLVQSILQIVFWLFISLSDFFVSLGWVARDGRIAMVGRFARVGM